MDLAVVQFLNWKSENASHKPECIQAYRPADRPIRRQAVSQIVTQRVIQTQASSQPGTQADTQSVKYSFIHSFIHSGSQSVSQSGRQAGRQAGRQVGKFKSRRYDGKSYASRICVGIFVAVDDLEGQGPSRPFLLPESIPHHFGLLRPPRPQLLSASYCSIS